MFLVFVSHILFSCHLFMTLFCHIYMSHQCHCLIISWHNLSRIIESHDLENGQKAEFQFPELYEPRTICSRDILSIFHLFSVSGCYFLQNLWFWYPSWKTVISKVALLVLNLHYIWMQYICLLQTCPHFGFRLSTNNSENSWICLQYVKAN